MLPDPGVGKGGGVAGVGGRDPDDTSCFPCTFSHTKSNAAQKSPCSLPSLFCSGWLCNASHPRRVSRFPLLQPSRGRSALLWAPLEAPGQPLPLRWSGKGHEHADGLDRSACSGERGYGFHEFVEKHISRKLGTTGSDFKGIHRVSLGNHPNQVTTRAGVWGYTPRLHTWCPPCWGTLLLCAPVPPLLHGNSNQTTPHKVAGGFKD